MTLLALNRHLVCPNCTVEMSTPATKPVLHRCKGHAGLLAPMVPAGIKADVRTVEREDYIGGDLVQVHEGRPIMAVVTEREDGQDVTVFAPTATGNGE